MTIDSRKPIESKANPRFKEIKRLIQHPSHYKRSGLIWIEGDHLVEAALKSGVRAEIIVMSEDFPPNSTFNLESQSEILILSRQLFAQLSSLPSSASIGALIRPDHVPELDASMPTIVMDRIQDAGNVGSILRSAAAFGFTQVIALKGTASLWGAKSLRAGMGAHFSLKLHEDIGEEELNAIESIPWLATSSHADTALLQPGVHLPWPCAWFLGNEGQGLSESLDKRCVERVRIDQPGGQESLNVAAAAAICLFASSLGRR